MKSPTNASILEEINSSAFVISLEESPEDSRFAHSGPKTPVAFSRALWHGDISADGKPIGLRNRWVDKPISFLVYDNGAAGLLGEHSIMDGEPLCVNPACLALIFCSGGTTPQRLCDEILQGLRDPTSDQGESAQTPPPKPVSLNWEQVPGIAEASVKANRAAISLIESQELGITRTRYGKETIKNLKVSPDSWAQMIVQLAYRRLLSASGLERQGGTYEAATTRKFFKGRTEAIRVVSLESDAWTKSMDDTSLSRSERRELFDKATSVHISRAKEAGNGKGIDRHLFGAWTMMAVRFASD